MSITRRGFLGFIGLAPACSVLTLPEQEAIAKAIEPVVEAHIAESKPANIDSSFNSECDVDYTFLG